MQIQINETPEEDGHDDAAEASQNADAADASQDDEGQVTFAESDDVEVNVESEAAGEGSETVGSLETVENLAKAEEAEETEETESADDHEIARAIEAILLSATEPIEIEVLATTTLQTEDKCLEILQRLVADYSETGRGFELAEVAGGWRYQTHPELYSYVERFALEAIPNRLSAAALETLSIVAYKQPISRSQMTAIRGVNVDAVLKTLQVRGYVAELGQDDGPGKAILFGTTNFFLEKLGVNSVAELPPLGEFVPSAKVLEALEQTLRIDPDSQDSENATQNSDVSDLQDSETVPDSAGGELDDLDDAPGVEDLVKPEPGLDSVNAEGIGAVPADSNPEADTDTDSDIEDDTDTDTDSDIDVDLELEVQDGSETAVLAAPFEQ